MKENTKLIESGPNSKTSLCKWPVVRVGHFVKIPFQFSLQNSLFFDTKLLKVNRHLDTNTKGPSYVSVLQSKKNILKKDRAQLCFRNKGVQLLLNKNMYHFHEPLRSCEAAAILRVI